jgi:hypothetical protein
MKNHLYILLSFALLSCEHKTDGIKENVQFDSIKEKDTVIIKDIVAPKDKTEVLDSSQKK